MVHWIGAISKRGLTFSIGSALPEVVAVKAAKLYLDIYRQVSCVDACPRASPLLVRFSF